MFENHNYLFGVEDYILHKLPHNTWYTQQIPTRQIDYQFLSDVQVKPRDDQPLLEFADCLAHACHKAFNADSRWGDTDPTLLELLAKNVWLGPDEQFPGTYGVCIMPRGTKSASWNDLPSCIQMMLRHR